MQAEIKRIKNTRYALMLSEESQKIGVAGEIILHICKNEVLPFSRPITPSACDNGDWCVHSSQSLAHIEQEVLDAIGVCLSDINDYFEYEDEEEDPCSTMYIDLETQTGHFYDGSRAKGWS